MNLPACALNNEFGKAICNENVDHLKQQILLQGDCFAGCKPWSMFKVL